jgi:hypothetical protein
MKAIAMDGHSNNVDADGPKSNLQLPSGHPSHWALRSLLKIPRFLLDLAAAVCPLFVGSTITLFIVFEPSHVASAQTVAWRAIGLRGVPVVSLLIEEKKVSFEEMAVASATVYAITPTDAYYSDRENSWAILNDVSVEQDNPFFSFSTTSGYGLISTSRYVLIRSYPLGSPWEAMGPGFKPNQEIISFAVARSRPEIMFVVLSNAGPDPEDDELAKTTDGGASWWFIHTLPRYERFLSLHDVYVNPRQSSVVYLTIDQGDVPWIIKSTDGGMCWCEIDHRNDVDEIVDLYFDPVRPCIVYFIGSSVQKRGIYKSTDGLATYTLKKRCDNILSLFIPTRDRQHIYALALPHTLLQSTDGGESWSTLSTVGLDSSAVVLSLAVDSHKAVYLGTAHHGIFKSERKKVDVRALEGTLGSISTISKETTRQPRQ